MASNLQNSDSEPLRLKLDTSGGALANIGFNQMLEADQQASSDEEGHNGESMPMDEIHSALGVSMSREQMRLMSPSTPAIEKAAAIERSGAFFGQFDGMPEVAEEDEAAEDHATAEERMEESDVQQVDGNQLSPDSPETKLPSPWRVPTNADWQTAGKRRSGIFEGFFNRKRASTGNESTLESLQRSLISSLPSVSKDFSISSSSSSLQTVKPSESSDSTDIFQSDLSQITPQQTIVHQPTQTAAAEDSNRRLSATSHMSKYSSTRSPLLRRSTSDGSMYTQRTLTRQETLGDDSRFEDVHDQVNSRMKAIQDSWQDATIKLPGVPALRVSSLTAESIRGRVGSLKPRSIADTSSMLSPTTRSGKPIKPTDPITRNPYQDAKAAAADATTGKMVPHPHFHRALEQLEGDLVLLGGYRGSVLRSAQAPHRQVWVPMKVGLNLRKVNLEVGFGEEDDERATERIVPDGMLTHIGPVDISRRLFKRLRGCENARSGKLKVWDYGYDWRLTPSHLSQKLISYLEKLPCNQPGVDQKRRGATVIAHSLGGLITRHAVNQRPELFAGVVYAGVPQTCVNILGPLRNGDEVLISNRVLTAQVNFSIRTSFALLPLDGRCFVDKETKEEYPVNFFDVNTWDELRLSPCINRPLPSLIPRPKPTGIAGYISSVASILPSVPIHGRNSSARSIELPKPTTAGLAAAPNPAISDAATTDDHNDSDASESVRTAVTIPRPVAIEYLTRTLASVKKFKQDLAPRPEHADANRYPPIAVIYGKSVPTVCGAKVDGREGIKHADAYDDLAFASGDGVVLARAAMVPEGYKTARGGIVASDRGHVTLLGDLEAVGKCLNAVIRSRRQGVGYGAN